MASFCGSMPGATLKHNPMLEGSSLQHTVRRLAQNHGGLLHALPREKNLKLAQINFQDVEPETPLQTQKSKPCIPCQGTSQVDCETCQGTGQLSRGGYQRRPSLPKELVNSKWTAMAETVGWRHFRVKQIQKKAKGITFALMQASCDPHAQLWVNRDALRDRSLWAAGWIPMSVVRDPQALELGKGASCRSCGATGKVACRQCVRAPSRTALIQL